MAACAAETPLVVSMRPGCRLASYPMVKRLYYILSIYLVHSIEVIYHDNDYERQDG